MVPPWNLISSAGQYIAGDCVDIAVNENGDYGIEMTAADDDGKVEDCKAATLLVRGDSFDLASNNQCLPKTCGEWSSFGMKPTSEGHTYHSYSLVVPPWSLLQISGNYLAGDCLDIPSNGDWDNPTWGFEMTAADDDGKVEECKAATLLLRGDSFDVSSKNKCWPVYCAGDLKRVGLKATEQAGHP